MKGTAILAVVVAASLQAGAELSGGSQSPPSVRDVHFDVISIKPHKDDGVVGGGMRTLPDGTFVATNIRIRQIINSASPEPVTDIKGLPDWTMTERYDVIAKPPPDSNPTPEQRGYMMHNMMIERFKIAGHLEEVDQQGFALVLARGDGRLGPQLKKSMLDCSGVDREKCGGKMAPGLIERNGTPLDQFATAIRGLAGGVVVNRTGLEGRYDLTLHFAPALTTTPASDDAPAFVTALQEQLGLKLVPERTTVKVFVIDHIERPTVN